MDVTRWFRLAWDRAAGLIFMALGALAVVLGWAGVSGEALPGKQLPYVISGGVAGLFLLGIGALFWLSADLRDEWIKLNEIYGELRRGDTARPLTDGHP